MEIQIKFRKISVKEQLSGAGITVFLTFLLPLLLALAGTVLESARVQSAKAVLFSQTGQSMQMMFSDYNKELWKDYHIFAYSGDLDIALKEIKRGLLEGVYGDGKKNGFYSMFSTSLTELSMENIEKITDEDGEILLNEIGEYTKYQIPADYVEQFMDLAGIIKETGSAAKVSQKKLETEEKMVQYSSSMLELISLTDGIDFGKNGIQYDGEKLKVKKAFIKQIVYGMTDAGTLGMPTGIVWDSLKEHYYDISTDIEKLSVLVKENKEIFQTIARMQADEMNLKQELEMILSELQELKEKEQKREETEENKVDRADRLKELMERELQIREHLSSVSESVKGLEKKKKHFVSDWNQIITGIKKAVSGVKISIKKAQDLLPELEKLQKQAAQSAKEYKSTLVNEKKHLSKERYDSFDEDCSRVLSAAGVSSESVQSEQYVCDLERVSHVFIYNMQVIEELEQSGISGDISEQMLDGLSEKLKIMKQLAKSYRHDISFSYQVADGQKKQDNPVDAIKKLVGTELLFIVMPDSGKISDISIPQEQVFDPMPEKKKKVSQTITDFSDAAFGSIGKMFGNYSSEVSGGDIVQKADTEKSVSNFLRDLLLKSYVQENFANAAVAEKEKETHLSYEQEYILCGQENDKENLSDTVMKVLTVRTVCNYLTLLSDGKRQAQAYEAAIAIAGMTGLEPLVEVLKAAILLVWAYDEGLVDTAALLQGKKIGLLKTPSQFFVSFPELMTIGRPLIQKKAGEISGQFGFAWDDYIFLFLCLQDNLSVLKRTANSIQWNLQKRYQSDFLLKESVFGCRICAEYCLQPVFLKLPYVSFFTGNSNGWEIKITTEQSY